MNARKSTQIPQVAHNYESLGKYVLLMTAKVDGRFGEGQITSRLGVGRPAECFDESTDMFECIKRFRDNAGDHLGTVMVDEAQFLSKEQVNDPPRGSSTGRPGSLLRTALGFPWPAVRWLNNAPGTCREP